ncbi:MAG: hypothetical protein IJ814_07465 [Paludibacteraceae bacterium]|nr:hypothetical protein [Paludibacteraceae bacterium]
MKKIFTTVIMACMLAVSAMAVTVNDVAGVFKGDLNIGGQLYNNKEVYILPGVTANTITFVLPDFKYGAASLGDIVLVNIPMNSSGKLTLENASLYIKAINERATINVLNGIQDGGTTYNSIVSSSSAQVLLSIAAGSLPEPIMVLFSGSKVTNKNYAVANGGFEGSWSNNEVSGWHSFPSATGTYNSFVTGNTQQFQKSTEIRPGSTGSQSARLQSNMVAGAKANGNCTNGQINAGSMSADDASGNYNFSDPSNNGYNTAFVGQPDSLVFWAKYIPADNNPSNSVNVARAHAAITQNARYQDPETGSSASVKIGDAAINYSATSDMGWQRLSTPFTYSSVDPSTAAYMLITFTTNYQPGGGSTYSTGSMFNKTYYYDNLYLDDIEMIYNHALTSLKMDDSAISFSNGKATSKKTFSDSDYTFAATTNGKASKSFIGYDEANNQVHFYVVGDNYSQTSSSYSVYTLQMAEPIRDTYYEYTASTCANEPYSDGLFSNLTKADTYTKTIPNAAGYDSIITLTLKVLPTYLRPSSATIDMDKSYTWRGHKYENLTPGVYTFADSLKTKAGCDSVYTLTLTVKAIGYSSSEEMTVCQNEAAEWHGKALPTAETGTATVIDSLQSVYGTDSVVTLNLTILPSYLIPAEATIPMDSSYTWRGHEYKDLVPGVYTYADSLLTQNGCDSVYTLTLTVEAIRYAFAEEATACQNEQTEWHGKALPTAQAGTVTVYDSLRSVYGTDSVYTLTLTVLPSWQKTETKYVNEADLEWRGQVIQGLAHSSDPYLYYDSLTAVNGCDSVYVLRLFVSDTPVTYGEYEEVICQGEQVRFNGAIYTEATDEDVHMSTPNMYGGDSIVHLTIIVLPSYTIDEYLNIVAGDQQSWEWQDLSHFPVGQYELYATYYTDDDCDSTLVLHLTVEAEAIESGIPQVPQDGRRIHKVLWNGHLYIIRDDETIYDIIGRKIQ